MIQRPTSPELQQTEMRRWLTPRATRFLVKIMVLGLIWGILTGFRVDAVVFGAVAVLAGAALVFVLPDSPGWRLSPAGAVRFALWFARQSVLGAVDVSRRAFLPRMPLHPGFRTYRPALPDGAPRIMFVNTITLLPGTLSAEIAGESVIVHMLDSRADLDSDLKQLETRVAALFALPASSEAIE